MKNSTVTSIVHHNLKPQSISLFENWFKHINQASSEFPGFIDSQMMDSFGGENEVITVFRFENKELLDRWLISSEHQEMLNQLEEITINATKINSYAGLEFWFQENSPGRLKMSVITFIGLLPLVLAIPPLFRAFTGLSGTLALTIETAIIVLLMSYAVMPGLLKLEKFLTRPE